MLKSKNLKVQKFLDEISEFDNKKFKILQKLREIVFGKSKKINEEIKYGGIMFSLEKNFGGIFVYKNHISFEFLNGWQMNDPQKILEGTGKFRRHLKFKKFSDIEKKQVKFFLDQMI